MVVGKSHIRSQLLSGRSGARIKIVFITLYIFSGVPQGSHLGPLYNVPNYLLLPIALHKACHLLSADDLCKVKTKIKWLLLFQIKKNRTRQT